MKHQEAKPWLLWTKRGLVAIALLFLGKFAVDFGCSKLNQSNMALSPADYVLPGNAGIKVDKPMHGSRPFDYKMVDVPGGTFMMGSPSTEARRKEDECQHEVQVAAFSIGQTEVTQALWKYVMGENPATHTGDKLPVESVSWDDVQVFLMKLNEQTGRNFRLPTEAEWEYAARGGQASQKTLYSGSDSNVSVAWEIYTAEDKTHPVATKAANELGLFDMSGNVFEWCQDQYGPYPGCTVPKTVSRNRVTRGGAWNQGADVCRVANRYDIAPTSSSSYIGFRLAID